MLAHLDRLYWFWANQSLLLLLKSCVLSGEAANGNAVVFGLTGPVFKHKIYRTQDKYFNHYTYDDVSFSYNIPPIT
jgi:hypothetical protein